MNINLTLCLFVFAILLAVLYKSVRDPGHKGWWEGMGTKIRAEINARETDSSGVAVERVQNKKS